MRQYIGKKTISTYMYQNEKMDIKVFKDVYLNYIMI